MLRYVLRYLIALRIIYAKNTYSVNILTRTLLGLVSQDHCTTKFRHRSGL